MNYKFLYVALFAAASSLHASDVSDSKMTKEKFQEICRQADKIDGPPVIYFKWQCAQDLGLERCNKKDPYYGFRSPEGQLLINPHEFPKKILLESLLKVDGKKKLEAMINAARRKIACKLCTDENALQLIDRVDYTANNPDAGFRTLQESGLDLSYLINKVPFDEVIDGTYFLIDPQIAASAGSYCSIWSDEVEIRGLKLYMVGDKCLGYVLDPDRLALHVTSCESNSSVVNSKIRNLIENHRKLAYPYIARKVYGRIKKEKNMSNHADAAVNRVIDRMGSITPQEINELLVETDLYYSERKILFEGTYNTTCVIVNKKDIEG